MRFLKTTLVITSLLFMANCGNKADQKMNMTDTQANKTLASSYTYSSDSTYVGFVAYKFNEKVGVPGWFTNFSAEGIPTTVNTPKELLTNLTFTVPVESLETGIDDRNQKIKEHFFGTINTENLTGKVVSVEGTETEGSAKVEIEMNGLTKVADLAYDFTDNVFHLSGTIDVTIWDALSGIKALNTVCDVLHRGTDGISKLWPTVDIDIKTTLSPAEN